MSSRGAESVRPIKRPRSQHNTTHSTVLTHTGTQSLLHSPSCLPGRLAGFPGLASRPLSLETGASSSRQPYDRCSVDGWASNTPQPQPTPPHSNGLVERFHRQLKDFMRARLAARDWPSHLPWVLLGLRAAPKEDHNVSAADLLYVVPLALHSELLETAEPSATSFLENLMRPPTSLPTRPIAGPQPASGPPKELSCLSTGELLVRLSHLYTYDGPYRVLASGPKFFTLQVSGRQD